MIDIFSLDMYYLVYFFLLVFLASFAIPTGALVLIVSFASATSDWNDAILLVALSLSATISGDYGAYSAARYFRKKINPMIEKIGWMEKKRIVVQKLFNRYSYHTVFLTRFLFSGIGPYVNYFSGLQNIKKETFLKAIILGEIVYCFFYVFIGYYFRETWQEIISLILDYTASIIFALLGLYIVYKIIKLLSKNK